jgi:hypothetical protein
MNRSPLRRAAVTLAGAALLAGGATQALAAQADTSASKGVTIKMKLRGSGQDAVPYFTKAKKVHRGAKLTIVNTTDVQAIGPHTFSLVKKKALPKGAEAQRECGEQFSGICGTVATAHEFNPQTMGVDKPEVEVGKKGWDKSFGKQGDSWYTETKGESYSRKVTAKAGTTLTFFCAVHPNMVGKIKVVK